MTLSQAEGYKAENEAASLSAFESRCALVRSHFDAITRQFGDINKMDIVFKGFCKTRNIVDAQPQSNK